MLTQNSSHCDCSPCHCRHHLLSELCLAAVGLTTTGHWEPLAHLLLVSSMSCCWVFSILHTVQSSVTVSSRQAVVTFILKKMAIFQFEIEKVECIASKQLTKCNKNHCCQNYSFYFSIRSSLWIHTTNIGWNRIYLVLVHFKSR